jgi:hypothetical protein
MSLIYTPVCSQGLSDRGREAPNFYLKSYIGTYGVTTVTQSVIYLSNSIDVLGNVKSGEKYPRARTATNAQSLVAGFLLGRPVLSLCNI